MDRKELKVYLQDGSGKGKWRIYLKRKQQYHVENFNSKENIKVQDSQKLNSRGGNTITLKASTQTKKSDLGTP